MQWSVLKKLGFLFLFCYFAIYILSDLLSSVLFSPLWKNVIPLFAKLVGYDGKVVFEFNGSGDTTYYYYRIFFFVTLSIIITIGIITADYKRKNYNKLTNWLVIIMRYYLAYLMISYGLAKIYYLQFRFPSPMRLDQTLGEFSPMGLLWTFMGFSKTYTIFTGFLEFLGGILLFSKRTTLLGALITFGVMLNVMMLNYCYDVPVKLLSTHLVLISLFLVLLNGQRLFKFFFTNKAIAPQTFNKNSILPIRHQKAKNIVKWILIFAFLAQSNYSRIQATKTYGDKAIKPLFYGKFEVNEHAIFNDTLGIKNIPEDEKWNTFYQLQEGNAIIKTNTNETKYYFFKVDTTNQIVEYEWQNEHTSHELKYEFMDSINVHLYGIVDGDSLDIKMSKVNPKDYQLINRGFNWINEHPFNR